VISVHTAPPGLVLRVRGTLDDHGAELLGEGARAALVPGVGAGYVEPAMSAPGDGAAPEVDSVITVAAGVLHARDVVGLREALVAALDRTPVVELDLRAVEDMSPDAVRALAECARLGSGIVFRFRGSREARGLSSIP
jgi:hypothetical protein